MPFFCIFARLSAHFGEFLHYLKEERYMIFTFWVLTFRHRTVTFGMIAKWKPSTAGVERCPLDTCNTKKKRQSRVRIRSIAARATIISYLALLERLFLISLHSNDCFERNRRRKNLPARWWSRQESDRSGFRGIERAKGVILPLDLGEYRSCFHGECKSYHY